MLSREEQTDLLDLQFHWDTAYRFQVTDGIWTATPAIDRAHVLTAESAWDLRELVRNDYAERQAAARRPVCPGE